MAGDGLLALPDRLRPRSNAKAQRGLKAQPPGIAESLGIEPGI